VIFGDNVAKMLMMFLMPGYLLLCGVMVGYLVSLIWAGKDTEDTAASIKEQILKTSFIIGRVSNSRCKDPINPAFHEARHTTPPDGIDKDQVIRPLDPFLRTKDKGIFLHPLSIAVAKDRIKVLIIETDHFKFMATWVNIFYNGLKNSLTVTFLIRMPIDD